MSEAPSHFPSSLGDIPDLVCLAHLRWQSAFQRPQQLMTRYARTRRVFFVEEPIFDDTLETRITVEVHDGVHVVVPHLPRALGETESIPAQRAALEQLLARERITRYVLWYYTPLALRFSSHLTPAGVAYDCIDELSTSRGAATDLPALERELMRRADVVFAGGQALYEAKKELHPNIHAVPGSVDVAHFAAARQHGPDPPDQKPIPRPRLGFFGVPDGWLDIPLLQGLADARPDWQLVMIGPVATMDKRDLPRRPNIHYLGPKADAELPRYIGGWDVALLPFARNEATRFINPASTPAYLAAGRPVVSTSIRDVVSPYGERGLVYIADTVADMARACNAALREPAEFRRTRADAFLSGMSWDRTWSRTAALLDAATAPVAPRPSQAAAASGA
jgi:glycosyltransferase involved in cell wall biosynthesis